MTMRELEKMIKKFEDQKEFTEYDIDFLIALIEELLEVVEEN